MFQADKNKSGWPDQTALCEDDPDDRELSLTQSLASSPFSAEAVGRAAERHEGGRDPPPGNHRPDTASGRAAADVREEHPEPAGEPRTRDTDATDTAGNDSRPPRVPSPAPSVVLNVP